MALAMKPISAAKKKDGGYFASIRDKEGQRRYMEKPSIRDKEGQRRYMEKPSIRDKEGQRRYTPYGIKKDKEGTWKSSV